MTLVCPLPHPQQGSKVFLNLIACGSKVFPVKESEYTWMKKKIPILSLVVFVLVTMHMCVSTFVRVQHVCERGRHYEMEIFCSLDPQ